MRARRDPPVLCQTSWGRKAENRIVSSPAARKRDGSPSETPSRFFAHREEPKRFSSETATVPSPLDSVIWVLSSAGAVSVIYNANVNIHLAQSESGERRNKRCTGVL